MFFALGQGLFDGHEVQGCVCAVGGDDLAGAVVQNTEFASFGVVADHGLVITVGQVSNLELDIALVGPEPRDARVFFGRSHQRVGGHSGMVLEFKEWGLFFSVGNRFESPPF